MCFIKTVYIDKIVEKPIADIIKEKAAGMSDAEKSAYASEIDQIVFENLLKVDVALVELPTNDWWIKVKDKYPTIIQNNIYGDDDIYYTVTKEELQKILSLDWSNLRTYIVNKRDCEDFAIILTARLVDYYGITSAHRVLGATTSGAHGWVMIVLKTDTGFEAFQVEPHSDRIFDVNGDLGAYTPIETRGKVE